MHTSLSAFASSGDNLQLIRGNPYLLACLCLLQRLYDLQLKAKQRRQKPKNHPRHLPICLDQAPALSDWQAQLNCQIKHPSHSPSKMYTECHNRAQLVVKSSLILFSTVGLSPQHDERCVPAMPRCCTHAGYRCVGAHASSVWAA